MERVDKAIRWFQNHPEEVMLCGVFDTRNIANDIMKTIYTEDGITIDACYEWDYIEVFGLSEQEFSEFKTKYDGLTEELYK